MNEEIKDSTPRVLIVDDDENMVVLLSNLLSNEGYYILSEQDGPEALEIIKNEDVSLVVSDYVMPKMNGLMLVREAKQVKPNLEIIIITGYGDTATHEAARTEGAFECFDKPLNAKEFRKQVRRAIFKGMFSNDAATAI